MVKFFASLRSLRQIRSLSDILPVLMMIFTGHPRQKAYVDFDVEWDRNNWTHDLFRVYEIIFGRRAGIRAEAAVVVDKDGTQYVQVFTIEAACAQLEGAVRRFFREWKIMPIRIYSPQLAPANGFLMPTPNPFLFAIAFGADLGDTVINNATASVGSLSISGTNLALFGWSRIELVSASVSSYYWDDGSGGSQEALTNLSGGYVDLEGTNHRGSAWYKLGPSTSNSRFICTISTTTVQTIGMSYYSGVKQSAAFTTASTAVDTASGGSQLDTSDQDGSWHVGFMFSVNAGSTAGADTTVRAQRATTEMTCDSNATVANTVTHTFNWTWGSQNAGWITSMMRSLNTTQYTLALAQGSYTLTGQALSLLRIIKITLAQGSYALTGQAAVIGRLLTMVAAQGAYVLTGQAVTITKNLRITLAQGSYTLTGQALALKRVYTAVLAYGSYTLTGIAVFIRTFYTVVTRNITSFTTVSRNSTSHSTVNRNTTNYSEVPKSG